VLDETISTGGTSTVQNEKPHLLIAEAAAPERQMKPDSLRAVCLE
jgi:hypothetical protein